MIPRSLLLVALIPALLCAEDKEQPKLGLPTITDPDFMSQGEYEATITSEMVETKVGIQVIARGDGDFDLKAFPGGLPGDGWYGGDPVTAKGTTTDGVTVFMSEKGRGVLEKGKLTAYQNNGDELAVFKRVTRASKTLGQKAPENAVVLFDGTSAKSFKNGRLTEDGLLREGVTSHETFGDCKIHLEFCLSWSPKKRGQQRANSGVYVQGRYEVQVLDSFGLEGKSNECGGVYSIHEPILNMCYPPMQWQTYDIDFTAAKFNEKGEKTANARMTVLHNGVEIHKDVEVPSPTRAAPNGKETTEPGPLYLQNHGNPIWYRNIWVVRK